jgi:pantothenate synthetase
MFKVVEWSKLYTPEEVREKAISFFSAGNLKLEYLEIVDDVSFQLLGKKWSASSSCCVAAYCGEVRLIDNMPCKMA